MLFKLASASKSDGDFMDLRISLAALGALGAGLLASPVPAFAQDSTPHVEQCTTWGFIQDIRYEFGVVNTCAYPIDVWFLSGTGAQAHGQVLAGGTFSTGLTRETADINKWISAACHVGYHPSLSVTAEHGETIEHSQYTCVRS